jgi:hypothetical protein
MYGNPCNASAYDQLHLPYAIQNLIPALTTLDSLEPWHFWTNPVGPHNTAGIVNDGAFLDWVAFHVYLVLRVLVQIIYCLRLLIVADILGIYLAVWSYAAWSGRDKRTTCLGRIRKKLLRNCFPQIIHPRNISYHELVSWRCIWHIELTLLLCWSLKLRYSDWSSHASAHGPRTCTKCKSSVCHLIHLMLDVGCIHSSHIRHMNVDRRLGSVLYHIGISKHAFGN